MSDEDALARVYAAKSAEELADAYAQWAAGYDRATLSQGYCLPFLIAAWVARFVPKGEGPLLDAGCGTGLTGPALAALGYDAVEGLDFSDEMLRIAASRGSYRRLIRATIGEPLPWAEGHFAAVFSTGVFTEGHAPASGFHELTRIVRPGGHVIATVRESIFASGGFGTVFAELQNAGRWTPVEASAPFRAFAIDEPEVVVTSYVFRVEH